MKLLHNNDELIKVIFQTNSLWRAFFFSRKGRKLNAWRYLSNLKCTEYRMMGRVIIDAKLWHFNYCIILHQKIMSSGRSICNILQITIGQYQFIFTRDVSFTCNLNSQLQDASRDENEILLKIFEILRQLGGWVKGF